MGNIAEFEEGRTGLVLPDACVALVEALKVAEEDDTRFSIAFDIVQLAQIEEGDALNEAVAIRNWLSCPTVVHNNPPPDAAFLLIIGPLLCASRSRFYATAAAMMPHAARHHTIYVYPNCRKVKHAQQ